VLLCVAILPVVAMAQSAPSTTQPVRGPARWEPEIAKLEAADARRPPPKHPIVFVGSSSIRLWKVQEAFADLPVLNRGFGGSVIEDATFYAPRIVFRYQPRAIVFYSGDNDLAAGHSPQRVADDFAKFHRAVRDHLPDVKLVVIGIKPSVKRVALMQKMHDANAQIRESLSADPHAVFIDVEPEMLGPDGKPRAELFRSDGLHMNEKGYEIWNRLLAPQLR
jgi:lysophospholipase L1-like esterase